MLLTTGWRSAARDALVKHRPQIEAAKKALEEVLQGERGRQLVHAVFAKFLIISDAEIEEWLVSSLIYHSILLSAR